MKIIIAFVKFFEHDPESVSWWRISFAFVFAAWLTNWWCKLFVKSKDHNAAIHYSEIVINIVSISWDWFPFIYQLKSYFDSIFAIKTRDSISFVICNETIVPQSHENRKENISTQSTTIIYFLLNSLYIASLCDVSPIRFHVFSFAAYYTLIFWYFQ